jgi:hypothetical protein
MTKKRLSIPLIPKPKLQARHEAGGRQLSALLNELLHAGGYPSLSIDVSVRYHMWGVQLDTVDVWEPDGRHFTWERDREDLPLEVYPLWMMLEGWLFSFIFEAFAPCQQDSLRGLLVRAVTAQIGVNSIPETSNDEEGA